MITSRVMLVKNECILISPPTLKHRSDKVSSPFPHSVTLGHVTLLCLSNAHRMNGKVLDVTYAQALQCVALPSHQPLLLPHRPHRPLHLIVFLPGMLFPFL